MKHSLTLFVLLGILLIAASAFSDGRIFDASQVALEMNSARVLCTADINADGIPDIVGCDESTNSLFVIVVYPNGTLRIPDRYDIGEDGEAVAVGDLNNDTYADIIVGREYDYDDYLGVMFGNGDGTFAAPVNYALYNSIDKIAVADIDGDTDLDLVATTSGVISVFKNNGDGTLAARVDYVSGNSWCYDVTAADIDGDTDMDMVLANYNGETMVTMFNDGSGVYDSLITYPIGGYTTQVAVGRFDDNDSPDIATVSRTGNKFTVQLNNGDGTYGDTALYPTGSGPWAIAAADLDGDTFDDLVITAPQIVLVYIYMNNGDGTFTLNQEFESRYSYNLTVGDYDQDGDIDIVLPDEESSSLRVMFNDGDGNFPLPTGFPLGHKATSVRTGDFNNDTWIDFAVANYDDDNVMIMLNNGDSTFTLGGTFAMGDGPVSLVAADFDGDDIPDIATVNDNSHNLTFRLNDGTGDFSAALTSRPLLTSDPTQVMAAKLNADDYNDLVVVGGSDDMVIVYFNEGPGDFVGSTGYTVSDGPKYAAAADIDGDTDLDLVVARDGYYEDRTNAVLINGGTGAFTDGTPIASDYYCLAVAAAELDGQPGIDLVFTSDDGGVYVNRNNGDGTFSDPVWYDYGSSGVDLFVADIDHVAFPDVVFTYDYGGYFSLLKNYGAGIMTEPTSYHIGTYAYSIWGADFDKDGDIDLVTATTTSSVDTAFIYWNRVDLVPTDVDDNTPGDDGALPDAFSLGQNYPNPFNPSTTIEYSLPKAAHVTVTVYNVLGQQVTRLVDSYRPAGTHLVTWDGHTDSGHPASTGVYFYRITAGNNVVAKKMVLLK